jgi:hypothetical protein
MCSPMALAAAAAALAIGGEVSKFVGQNQAAAANKQAANINYGRTIQATNDKAVQLDQAKSENAVDTAITSIQSEGRIAASASEQGLAPTSIVQALNANQFGIGRNVVAEDINDENARKQLTAQREGAQMTRYSQIASVPKGSVTGLVLGIGKAGLDFASANAKANG